MNEAHHMGYRLLSGIKNDFILKFPLYYLYYDIILTLYCLRVEANVYGLSHVWQKAN